MKHSSLSSPVVLSMKPAYLVLDLETVTDVSLPPLPKKRSGEDAFGAPPYHEIVAMGAALLDEDHMPQRLWIVGEQGGADERGTLAALVGFLGAHPNVTIVTWNGRGFDLPVIAARCLRHGIAFPWYYQQRSPRYRYAAEGHLDLMDFLIDYGACRAYSLDVAAKLVGLPGKMDVDGSNVQAMVDAGQIEQVRAYCLSDVVQTTAILLRTQLLRGVLDAFDCARALQALVAMIEREARLATMLPNIHRSRLIPQVDAGAEYPGVRVVAEATDDPDLRTTSRLAKTIARGRAASAPSPPRFTSDFR
jgi:predicted PolB exonuclease-like 3'-5' exonuclease